jgi:hypothetical protein
MNANNNNSQIDFGLLPKNIPSLCIPRVFPNISESRIRKTFEDIFIGRIEKIDIIKGDKFNRVFVHLIWNNTSDALYVRNQVMTGKDVKVVYDGPWFWMVSASRNQSPPPQQQQQQYSHKTDEFGRELRMQEQPTPTPMQRQYQQPPLPTTPPPPPPMQRRQHACFQPPLPPTPPPLPNYHHNYHQQRQQQQSSHKTDEFGRDIRRQAPPPPVRPVHVPVRRPVRVPVKQDKKSWASYDDEIDTDDEEDLIKPAFIPQSPTTTPPSLRHKQIKVQDQEDNHLIEEEEEKEEETTITMTKKNTRFTDVDQPKTSELIQVKYDVVIPLTKIRGNINKKSKK